MLVVAADGEGGGERPHQRTKNEVVVASSSRTTAATCEKVTASCVHPSPRTAIKNATSADGPSAHSEQQASQEPALLTLAVRSDLIERERS